MKIVNTKIIFILCFILSTVTWNIGAQINTNGNPSNTIGGQNPFMDASNFSNFPNTIGKGFYFPRTDLTTWTFNTAVLDGITFPTAYDGMIVYNTGTGQTVLGQGQQTNVDVGFYYFYNPVSLGLPDISNGIWLPIGVNTDNQNISGSSLVGTNLTIGIENGSSEVIDLSSLSGGAQVEPWFGTDDDAMATDNSENMYVLSNWVGIGTNTGPSSGERLRVNGSILTNTSTYPDYVFESYFEGSSSIKSDYKFNPLYKVEEYIKTNKHLPGVTSIKKVLKTNEGYSYNISELSIQSLEKLEELYLYTIEQEKKIDQLSKENEELKNRLANIETALGIN